MSWTTSTTALTITQTSNASSKIAYICTVPGHAAAGMKGKLTVT